VLENGGQRGSVEEPLVCTGGEAGACVGGGDVRVFARRPDWDDGDIEVPLFLFDIQN
jgi:hypothetical protein